MPIYLEEILTYTVQVKLAILLACEPSPSYLSLLFNFHRMDEGGECLGSQAIIFGIFSWFL